MLLLCAYLTFLYFCRKILHISKKVVILCPICKNLKNHEQKSVSDAQASL